LVPFHLSHNYSSIYFHSGVTNLIKQNN
jgi:hypothetical protein